MSFRELAVFAGLLAAASGQAFAATSFTCVYTTYTDESGVHKVTEDFSLNFLVDESANRAYVTGKLGTSNVEIVPGIGGMTLVETTTMGNVMVTVILDSGVSVHSRTTIIVGKVVSSQYFGKCSKK